MGLRPDSRIRMKIAGIQMPQEDILLAMIYDAVKAFHYGFTEDARKRRRRPESLAQKLMSGEQKEKDKPKAFASPEEFEEARRRIIERCNNG